MRKRRKLSPISSRFDFSMAAESEAGKQFQPESYALIFQKYLSSLLCWFRPELFLSPSVDYVATYLTWHYLGFKEEEL